MIIYLWFVTLIELILIALGPCLIALDIAFLSEWLHSLGDDFYVIMALAALISIWSIFGLIITLSNSKHGFKIYLIGLTSMIIIQFMTSFIHSILLFQYQPLLLYSCLQKQSISVFWWSLGGSQNNPMMKEYNDACAAQWAMFVKHRIISICVYNIILLFCLFVITSFQQRQIQAQNEANEEEKRIKSSMQFPDQQHQLDEVFITEIYRQRQKIFDEIAKRREARQSTYQRNSINNPPPPPLPIPYQYPPPSHFEHRMNSTNFVSHSMLTTPGLQLHPLYNYDDSKIPLLDSKDEQELLLSPPSSSSTTPTPLTPTTTTNNTNPYELQYTQNSTPQSSSQESFTTATSSTSA